MLVEAKDVIKRQIQGETWFGLSLNLIDHGKKVCKDIHKKFWKWFWKVKDIHKKFEKDLSLKVGKKTFLKSIKNT